MSAYAFIMFFLTTFAFALIYWMTQPLAQAAIEFYFMNYKNSIGDWINNIFVFFFSYAPILFLVFNALYWLRYAATQKEDEMVVR